MNNDLKLILKYLNEKRSFDFSGYRASMIERRAGKRLSASKCKDYDEYLHFIREHPDEIDNLVDVLTINVSRFFRDSLSFEYIAERILPVIVHEKKNSADHCLRIWSTGCSMGEEPYTLAILINEIFEKEDFNFNLNIFATDIDSRALKKAKEAVYSFESIKDVKYRLLTKYFMTERESFRLIPEIKNVVTFAFYNMLEKKSCVPPESIYGDFDMVFCRNVLIYFNTKYQDLIFDKLYRALAKHGYLILGEAEKPSIKFQTHFKKVSECCHLYQKM
ncbi:MAG: protein-glutamate O-methyltransferase CheR [Desulfobacteraceae bacterium]|nr:protein-glutamate O-methyltransferase CheR [Desulfobacteraceae bacterium]MBC2719618.1 protein-glutamate O-methyltransferase CheR [Desulfobacteraceae bacterium]